jgi:hypothetical protein
MVEINPVHKGVLRWLRVERERVTCRGRDHRGSFNGGRREEGFSGLGSKAKEEVRKQRGSGKPKFCSAEGKTLRIEGKVHETHRIKARLK